VSVKFVTLGDGYSWDDIIALVELRTMTVVKGVEW